MALQPVLETLKYDAKIWGKRRKLKVLNTSFFNFVKLRVHTIAKDKQNNAIASFKSDFDINEVINRFCTLNAKSVYQFSAR